MPATEVAGRKEVGRVQSRVGERESGTGGSLNVAYFHIQSSKRAKHCRRHGETARRLRSSENDRGIFYESLSNHDALLLRQWQQAEVWLHPVDDDRRSYPFLISTILAETLIIMTLKNSTLGIFYPLIGSSAISQTCPESRPQVYLGECIRSISANIDTLAIFAAVNACVAQSLCSAPGTWLVTLPAA